LLLLGVFFVQDVGELRRIEDFAAYLTFYELSVFLAGDDTDLGMFAGGRHIGKVV
jgi:hypothetical protein